MEENMQVKNPKFEISAVGPKQYPSGNLPEIVLVGKSNVGKSSFINTMLNRKNLARTSNTPGKTRQINFYNIDDIFYFVDLPGYGYSKMSKEEKVTSGRYTMEVDIRPEDIKMDVFRASGAGGQHINKTSSAVRLTHLPTGIVVSCQTQRSQYQNKDYAMKMLRAKLVEIKEREHLDKIADIKGVQKEIAWGAQIRSYVFMPYTLVKDHRTGFENGNIQAVMDGDLDGFINAYLKALSSGTLQK